MGWSNYVIIESLKIAVEVSRYLHDLENYEKESLDYILEEKDIDDLGDIKVSCLTIRELSLLTLVHDKVCNLNGIDANKLLIYWLESRKIEYEIKSEYDVNTEDLLEKGYAVFR